MKPEDVMALTRMVHGELNPCYNCKYMGFDVSDEEHNKMCAECDSKNHYANWEMMKPPIKHNVDGIMMVKKIKVMNK